MILAAAVALQRRRRDSVFRFVRERLCYAELRAIERQYVNFFYYYYYLEEREGSGESRALFFFFKEVVENRERGYFMIG
jgi:hypothetical protein